MFLYFFTQELHEQQRAADELLQGTPVPSTPSTSSDVTESKGASSVPSIPSTPSTPGPGHTPATSSQHSREASSSGVSLSLAESTSSMVPVSVKQVSQMYTRCCFNAGPASSGFSWNVYIDKGRVPVRRLWHWSSSLSKPTGYGLVNGTSVVISILVMYELPSHIM